MKNLFLAIGLTTITGLALAAFPDARDPVPQGWTGHVFKLSQDYPSALPTGDAQPWMSFNPLTQPADYVNAVYRYVLEGNVESEWEGSTNKVRTWYHAPWLHFGPKGRDFVRGLTRERGTPRAQPGKDGELGPQHKNCSQNWAVSLVNPAGGYQLGKIWKDPINPDMTSTVLPEGTVVTKLLFVTAGEDEVPYLKNTLQWDAYIHEIPASDLDCKTEGVRKIQKVRLMQIDLAVKDKRAGPTGWVFATMVYDGDAPGATVFDRMIAVGSQWGNDPGLAPDAKPRESWINTANKTPQHLGPQGRLNGPLDNPKSSCMSCHSTAQIPTRSAMQPRSTVTPTEYARWFRNLPGDVAFDEGSTSTDYSLQTVTGIENVLLWKKLMGGAYVQK